MVKIIDLLPQIETDEILMLNDLANDLNPAELKRFAHIYESRRIKPEHLLFATLATFLGFGGINRILLGQIGMGVLYLFTLGLCFIGAIVDLINYKDMALSRNRDIATEVRKMM